MSWKKHIHNFQNKLKTQNVITTNILEESKTRYFGMQFWLFPEDSKKIIEHTKKEMKSFSKYIEWMNPDNIHFTIQGHKIVTDKDISAEVISQSRDFFDEYFSCINFPAGKLIFPIVGQTGVITVFDEKNADIFYRSRIACYELFKRLNLEPTVAKQYFELAHSFLGRFKSQLPKDMLAEIINVPTTSLEVNFREVKLTISDKFISERSVDVISSIIK